MSSLPAARFSDLIGSIYDCVLDPERWPAVMARVCRETDCSMSGILLADLIYSQHRFFKTYNVDAQWMARLPEYFPDITALYRASAAASSPSLDNVLVLSRDAAAQVFFGTRYYREWTMPQGICDIAEVKVLQDRRKLGVFSVLRHESAGVMGDREVELLRLFAPHIRRAVTISDVMDLKTLTVQALEATIETLAAGVFVIGADRRILHANGVAHDMLKAGTPVCLVNGQLAARDAGAKVELAKAIALAQSDEAEIGAAGIGLALPDGSGEPAVAHVLPLLRGDLRSRLVPQAVAAVFVARAGSAFLSGIEGIAEAYRLTPAEARLLAALVAGQKLSDYAKAAGIGIGTARTHLKQVLNKSGHHRQVDLVRAVLANPLTGLTRQ